MGARLAAVMVVVAGCQTAAPPSPAVSSRAPAIASADAPSGRATVVSISDLPNVVAPTGPTTALLGRRDPTNTAPTEAGGVRISTTCGRDWCVDGAVDSGSGSVLSRPDLSRDEREITAEEGAWLERVVRVAFATPQHVSLYIATSEWSGGAHANNTLRCRTFDRRSGRVLRLGDVVAAQTAARAIARAQALTDDATALETLGHEMGTRGRVFSQDSFRFGHVGGPGLILCGEGDYPSESGSIAEISLESLAVRR